MSKFCSNCGNEVADNKKLDVQSSNFILFQ